MSYITPNKALAHLDRLAAWKAGEKPSPVTVEWDLSNACSLGCQSCHFAHTHTRGPWAGRMAGPEGYEPTGTLADERLVRRALGEARQAGVEAVIWSGGGEPTLHPAWEEIVAYAARQGLQQGIYTLGGHLSAAGAWTLRQCAQWAVISLDAVDAATYASEKGVPRERWEQACEGVRRLSTPGSGLVVGVSFLLHGGNWSRAADMRHLAKDLGAGYVTFRPTIETSPSAPGTCTADRKWVTDALPTLAWLAEDPFVEVAPARFVQYRDWVGHGYSACHGIKLSTVVTPDGRMWVCPQRRGVTGSCVGDLRTESFMEAWARHPGQWTNFAGCRAMCRMHLVNQTLEPVFTAYTHEAFV